MDRPYRDSYSAPEVGLESTTRTGGQSSSQLVIHRVAEFLVADEIALSRLHAQPIASQSSGLKMTPVPSAPEQVVRLARAAHPAQEVRTRQPS
jgi:hypothetical protein